MIKLKNLSKYYNNNGIINMALNNISISLPNNGMYMISGENGCGKSTLLSVLSGLEDYDTGEYLYNECDILDDSKLKNDVYNLYATINQDYRLFDNLTVLENLLLIPSKTNKTMDKIDDILSMLGIIDLKYNKVCNISGGEQQRVCIARAILMEKKVLLCDEATANLDKENELIIYKLLKDLSKTCLILIVSHNKKNLEPFIDGMILMKDGQIVENTIPQFLFNDNQQIIPNKNGVYSKRIIYKALNFKSKTLILSALYFLLFVFVMILAIYFSNQNLKYSSASLEENVFSNNDPLRIVIDNVDSKIEENDNLKSILENHKFLYNDYDLDSSITLYSSNTISTYSQYYSDYKFKFSPVIGYDYEVICGKLPENTNEVFMLGDFSDTSLETSYYVKDMLNTKFKYMSNTFIICGVGQVKNESRNLNLDSCVLYSESILDIYKHKDYNTYSYKYFNYNKGSYKDTVSVKIDNNFTDGSVCLSNDTLADSLYYRSTKVDFSSYERVLPKTNVYGSDYVIMNYNTYLEILDSVKTRLTIYLNDVNEKDDIVKMLSDYNVIIPYDYNYSYSNSNNYILYRNVTIIIGAILLIVYVFIRYFFNMKNQRRISIVLMLGISKGSLLKISSLDVLVELFILESVTLISLIVCNLIFPSLSSLIYISLVSPLIILFDYHIYNRLLKKNVNYLYHSEVRK